MVNNKTKSNNPNNADRKAAKGGQRSKATILRLNMINNGGPIRNKDGKVIGGDYVMNNRAGGKMITGQARIAPDRRWFGNTRVIAQTELDTLREQVSVQNSDPYSFVLRRKKIPMSLLQESDEKVAKVNILATESFDSVFSKKTNRKRPKLSETVSDYEGLMNRVQEMQSKSESSTNNHHIEGDFDGSLAIVQDDMFAKGQSKRIWGELYKVLDCSDVVIQVLDARNVPGTRSYHIEKHLKKNAPHKQLILVINKCDLVPSWATRKWIKLLSKDYPTIAFHANMNNAFGKGALITLLRQFTKLHSDKRQISVGIIGYPNTGKSSIINTLTGQKCCKAAPVPGETKVWQYVTLTKKIFLIDSPGVVYDVGDDEVETVLKGVVRSERLKEPVDFVAPMLARLKVEHLQKVYGVQSWENDIDFLTKVAKFKGKLLPSGEPDLPTIAKIMINDWQRGKLPFFVAPPKVENEDESEDEEDADDGIVGVDESKIGEDVEDEEDDEEMEAVEGAVVDEEDEDEDEEDDE